MSLINAVSCSPFPSSPIIHQACSQETSKLSQELHHFIAKGQITETGKNLINRVKPIELKQALDIFMQEICQFVQDQDPIKILHQLAGVIPRKKLEDAIRTQFGNHKNALQTAQMMMKTAKHFLHTNFDLGAKIKAKFSALLDHIITFLESVITAFGIADFFKQPENDMQANLKFQRIMTLISFFMMLTTTLLPLLGVATGGIFVGAALLTICVLSLIYPYIKPVPSHITKAKNYSKIYRQGDLVVTGGRKESMRDLAKALVTTNQSNRHAMLLGKSGVGKTQTIQAMVEAIQKGQFPGLEGKVVMYFNVADLISGNNAIGGDTKILQKISDTMGRHRDKIIIVFDEIHKACQRKEGADLCGQLLTLLDKGEENFPYFIGITTEEDYFRYIHKTQSAFARRFKRILIDDTPPAETIKVLRNMIAHQSPNTIVEKGALKYLLKKTQETYPNSPQPGSAVKILSECIIRTKEMQKSKLEVKVDKLRDKIERAQLQNVETQGDDLLPYNDKRQAKIAKWEAAIRKLEEILDEEKTKVTKLHRSKELLFKVKSETFKTVVKVENMKRKQLTAKNETDLNQFLLLSHFLAPILKQAVQHQAEKHGLELTINKKLIDAVIHEEKISDDKAQAAIERGKKQLEERK